jgi:hypothetical protein
MLCIPERVPLACPASTFSTILLSSVCPDQVTVSFCLAPDADLLVAGIQHSDLALLPITPMRQRASAACQDHLRMRRVAVTATVAKGDDLDCAWRTAGEAYGDAKCYLAAAEAKAPPGTWWTRTPNA